MIKKLLAALLALLFAAAAFAAVDANTATQAELETVKGIGPALSTKIIDERKKGSFKDWQDMVTRVNGVGEKNSVKFSTGGLTVNGATFAGAPAAAIKAPTSNKTATATAAPKTSAAATTAAVPPAAAASTAAEKKAAAKQAKEEKKAEKAAAKAAKAGSSASMTTVSQPQLK